jgi:hypothetical protein
MPTEVFGRGGINVGRTLVHHYDLLLVSWEMEVFGDAKSLWRRRLASSAHGPLIGQKLVEFTDFH